MKKDTPYKTEDRYLELYEKFLRTHQKWAKGMNWQFTQEKIPLTIK